MYKNSVLQVQSCWFTLSSYAFLTLSSPLHLKLLLLTIPCDQSTEFSRSKLNCYYTDFNREGVCDSSVVPSILVRKVENESFPCTHNLGERTGPLWREDSRRELTHQKNSGVDTVRRLGPIIQSIFVPNQEPAFAWSFGNDPVRVGTQGLFCSRLKTFVEHFMPARLTAPRCPRMEPTYIYNLIYTH